MSLTKVTNSMIVGAPINVLDYGAVADGTTDCYAAIQAACAALQTAGGGTLVFPKGTYFLNQFRIDGGASANGITNFTFTDLNGIVIQGNGSNIVCVGGWVRTADYSAGGFTFSYKNNLGFTFDRCNNIAINDLSFNGGIATVTKVATAEGVSYGIILKGCEYVEITNVNSNYCGADGLGVSYASTVAATSYKSSKYVTVTNCNFDYNARVGMSITGARNVTSINCTFSYTGDVGTFGGGYAPRAGVDIEPDLTPLSLIPLDDYSGNITFINCLFKDNNGFEFIATSQSSVKYPVELFGCHFENTTGIAPQIVTAVKKLTLYSCLFNNVGLYPGYTFNDDNHSEVILCRFVSTNSSEIVILHAQANPTLIVDRCEFQFNGAIAHTNSRLQIQAINTEFTNNTIFISGTEYVGTTFDICMLLQSARKVTGNRWNTDLATVGKNFTVAMDSSIVDSDYFVNPTYFSRYQIAWTIYQFSQGNKPYDQLINANTGKIIASNTAAPTTGTWAIGDIVFNSAATAGGYIGFVCTTAGSPGTWKTFGAISV
jgi:hypothetical protein